ncbi:MAG TPA: PQQ-binding-like beta-propeller repeat protein [Polyangiales bacterium]|nr:PQQ-binding-like beta-propeller repeat protein [Polyangiales bacterium]
MSALAGCKDDAKDEKKVDVDAGSDAGAATGPSDTWSHMGFDQKNNYFNPNEKKLSVKNAGSLVEKWRFKVAGYPPGSPVIGEGKVFALSTRGMYAIDLHTGVQVWSRLDIGGGTSSVAFEPGFVYVHTGGAALYKLSSADGTTVWGPKMTAPRVGCDGTSSPVIAGDKVLVGHACGPVEVGNSPKGTRGGVKAFDTADGSLAWTYFTVDGEKEDGASVWSTVAVDLDSKAVYAATGNNYTMQGENSDSIHAIDLDKGTQLWKRQVRNNDTWSYYGVPAGPDTDFGANPVLLDVGGNAMVAAGDKGGAFWGIDRITGAQLWSNPKLARSHNATHGGVLNNGAFDGKYIYCIANDPVGKTAVVNVLDPANGGNTVWQRTFEGVWTWAAPSLANGVLVAPIDTTLHVLDAKDGHDLISFDTGGTIAGGAAAIVDGMIVVKSGLQYVFDPSTKNNDEIIAYGLP